MPVRYQLVIDCADADRLARFWADALHYVLAAPPAGHPTWDDFYRSIGVPEDELGAGEDRIEDPSGEGPQIWFQVVPEAKTVKNRLHLDVRGSAGRAPRWPSAASRSRPRSRAWWRWVPAGCGRTPRKGWTTTRSRWPTPRATSSTSTRAQPSPASCTQSAICTRFSTSSLLNSLPMCALTVGTLR